jgi:hypothetical protein
LPSPTAPPAVNVIPAGGDNFIVTGAVDFSFTPGTSGIWEFRTSNNNGDPLLTLFNSAGIQIARDDDSAGGMNSLISHNLTAGQTYRLNAGFWNNGTGSYTLAVSRSTTPANPLVGYWDYSSGTGPYIYYFMVDGDIEFFANGRVIEYAYGEPGTYTVNGNRLIVIGDWDGIAYNFTFTISGDRLTIIDHDGDTGTWLRDNGEF